MYLGVGFWGWGPGSCGSRVLVMVRCCRLLRAGAVKDGFRPTGVGVAAGVSGKEHGQPRFWACQDRPAGG